MSILIIYVGLNSSSTRFFECFAEQDTYLALSKNDQVKVGITHQKIRHSWAAFFQQHFYIFFVLRFFLPNRTFVKHFLQKKKTETSFCVCVVGFTSELHRPLKQTNLNWILLNDHRSASNSDSLKNLIQTGLDSRHFNLFATSQTYYHQQIGLHS
jgi:hypothetical protein